MKNAPLPGFINPADNKPFPATFFSNEGGGINGKNMEWYLKKNILPRYPDLSATNPGPLCLFVMGTQAILLLMC